MITAENARNLHTTEYYVTTATMNQTFKKNPRECVKLLYNVSLTEKDIRHLDKEHQSWRQNKELQRELFN